MEDFDLKYRHAITIEHAEKYKLKGFETDDIVQQFKLDDETAMYKYSNGNLLLVHHNGYDLIFRSNKKLTLTLGEIKNVAILEWV